MASAARQILTDDTFRDARQAIQYCYAKGWTDGLPVVPLLRNSSTSSSPRPIATLSEVVMAVQHLDRTCTVRQAAINAVMAGRRAAPGWMVQ